MSNSDTIALVGIAVSLILGVMSIYYAREGVLQARRLGGSPDKRRRSVALPAIASVLLMSIALSLFARGKSGDTSQSVSDPARTKAPAGANTGETLPNNGGTGSPSAGAGRSAHQPAPIVNSAPTAAAPAAVATPLSAPSTKTAAPPDVVSPNAAKIEPAPTPQLEPATTLAAERASAKAPPLRTVMTVGSNPFGLTATVSRPLIQASKWTIMTVTVTLRVGSEGLIALPADVYYNMPGWSAEVGGTAAPCTSNNDRVRWPGERGKAITMSAGDEVALPIEFTCGHGGDFQSGGAVTIRMQLLADSGSGTRSVRMSANDIAYTQK